MSDETEHNNKQLDRTGIQNPNQIVSKMPSNKKQRGRESKKKNEAQKKADSQRMFGTPAVDNVIKDIAAMEKEDGVVCYHGSSAEHFLAGSEFLNFVKSDVVLNKKYDNLDQFQDVYDKFMNENANVECTNFIFALGVALYLKLTCEEKESYHRLQMSKKSPSGKMKQTPSFELECVLELGLYIKYEVIPHTKEEENVDDKKFHKYMRDVENERGVINCLYREAKNNKCDCMTTKKIEANDMDKMDLCHGCRKRFPKARTKLCDGCEVAVYCSDECQSNDWLRHKPYCTDLQPYCTDLRGRINNNKTKKKKKRAATTSTATSNANGSISTPGAVVVRTNKPQSSPTAIEEPQTTTTAKPKNLAAAAIIGVIALAGASYLGLGSFTIAPATLSPSPIPPSPTVVKVVSGGEGKTEY